MYSPVYHKPHHALLSYAWLTYLHFLLDPQSIKCCTKDTTPWEVYQLTLRHTDAQQLFPESKNSWYFNLFNRYYEVCTLYQKLVSKTNIVLVDIAVQLFPDQPPERVFISAYEDNFERRKFKQYFRISIYFKLNILLIPNTTYKTSLLWFFP